MNLNQIELKNTGVLFFDILNGFYHYGGDTVKNRLKPVVDNAVLVMRGARAANLPIFFAKSNHRRDGATSALVLTDTDMALKPWPAGKITRGKHPAVAGEPSSDVIPELEPGPDDYYILKYRRSAFFQTYFDLALRARDINTLIVSGCHTETGVAATIFAARDLDYNLIVVRDACGTIHHQQAHDVLMDLVYPRMCRIRTTGQVLEMIKAAS